MNYSIWKVTSLMAYLCLVAILIIGCATQPTPEEPSPDIVNLSRLVEDLQNQVADAAEELKIRKYEQEKIRAEVDNKYPLLPNNFAQFDKQIDLLERRLGQLKREISSVKARSKKLDQMRSQARSNKEFEAIKNEVKQLNPTIVKLKQEQRELTEEAEWIREQQEQLQQQQRELTKKAEQEQERIRKQRERLQRERRELTEKAEQERERVRKQQEQLQKQQRELTRKAERERREQERERIRKQRETIIIPPPGPTFPPPVNGALGGQAPYAVVRVFYGTDRNLTNSSKPSEMYGSDRAQVTYGICEVSVPRDHRKGELESPSIWRLEFREDPSKHVVLLNVSVKEKNSYFSNLATHIQNSSDRKALLFVHGYNITFEDAARRTAQMSYDLEFDGVPVFYSWPSQGTFAGYPVDETNIEWSQTNLQSFLADFVERTRAENIYLIAHSMGNRALTRAFSLLVAEIPTLRQRFKEIILAAPDIDAQVFKRDIAPRIVGDTPAVTLYASSEDKALLASKKFHRYPRAGDAEAGVVIVKGIETIDATGLDTSLLGHSYYAEVKSILADMFYLIENGLRADNRFALKPVNTPNGRYWIFNK